MTFRWSSFRTLGLLLATPVATLALASCKDATSSTQNGGTTPQAATVRVQITDAPSVALDSAIVYIGAVTLLPDSGPPIVVTDNAGRFDLLQLQNGVTAEIGALAVDSGSYHELRMVVDSAMVGLAPGYQFRDGTTERSLKVPSGSESGIKVKLRTSGGDSSVVIAPGETILVVDFDVQQNFKIQGNPNTPAGLQGILFTPVLRAVVRNVAGSIAGTVTSSADGTPIAGLTVRATLQGTSEEATAVTQDDGTYVIQFLAPGTYDVQVDSFSASAQTVTVGEGQNVTGVDFSGTST
jgi:hypothetical protein